VDYKVILNLMKEMNRTDLTKLEIEQEGVRICMEKSNTLVTMAQPALPQVTVNSAVAAPVGQQPVEANTTSESGGSTVAEKSEEFTGKKLVSPMVGTFYAQPSPDKPPFVKVGDKVKKGQTICIIEAMKLMNEIESEYDGEIVKVLVNNEDMVEFGQPLFLIK
jgi:acetyl-CoA carboxylase biotin carboxyl carrier protein